MSEKFDLLMWRVDTAKARYAQIHNIQINYRLDLASLGDGGHSKVEKEAFELLKWIEAKIDELVKALPLSENDPRYDPHAPKWQKRLDLRFDIWKSHWLRDSFYEKHGVDFDALFRDWDELIGKQDAYIALFVKDNGKPGKATFLARMASGKKRKAERLENARKREEYLAQAIKVLRESIEKVLSKDPNTIRGLSKAFTVEHISTWEESWKKRYQNLDIPDRTPELRDALKKMFDEMTQSVDTISSFLPREQEIAQIEYWLEKISAPEIDVTYLDTESIQGLSDELKAMHKLLFEEAPIYWVDGDVRTEKVLAQIENFLERRYGKFAETVGTIIQGVNCGFYPGYNDKEVEPFMYVCEDHLTKSHSWRPTKAGIVPVTGKEQEEPVRSYDGRKANGKVFN
jgi:hypothetical protein